jgi:hypothetical protein
MNGPAKAGIVLGGYAAAAFLAFAVVYVWSELRPDRDTSSGMAAFGDAIFVFGLFAVGSVPATCAALYFLRPYPVFWRFLSFAGVALSLSGAAAAICFFVSRRALQGSALAMWGAFAVLRILSAPLFALALFAACAFAPDRPARRTLLIASLIESAAFGSVVVIAWLPALLNR